MNHGPTLLWSGPPPAWHFGRETTSVISRLAARAPARSDPLSSSVGPRTSTVEAKLLGDCNFDDPCYHLGVNGTHRKTLEKVLRDPVNGTIEWSRIESLLKAAGCRVVEGAGSSVTFEFNGRKMTLHRPHPGKEALRYRVSAVREFIEKMGVKP